MSIKTEREKKWRKASRKTLSFELTTEKDADIIEFWAAVNGPKVDVFRNLSRLAMALVEWAAIEGVQKDVFKVIANAWVEEEKKINWWVRGRTTKGEQ